MPARVVLRPVRTGVAVLQGQGERAVVELEAEQGVEQGGDALGRRGVRPERRRAGSDGGAGRFEPGLVQRAEQPGPVAEGPEQRALADAGRRRDLGHGDVLGVLPSGEQGVGCRENGLPVADGVLAGPVLGHASAPLSYGPGVRADETDRWSVRPEDEDTQAAPPGPPRQSRGTAGRSGPTGLHQRSARSTPKRS